MALASAPPCQSPMSTPRPDPFWQSMPQTGSASLDDLVSAIQKVVPTPTRFKAEQQSLTQATTARKPTCTHTHMIRIHGLATCDLCGRIPSMGWLYACQQDYQNQDPLPDMDAAPVIHQDGGDQVDAKAYLAEYLQMNPSVIRGIRAREYSVEQTDRLIEQKKNAIRVLFEKENDHGRSTSHAVQTPTMPAEDIIASVGSTATALPLSDLPMSTAGTPANTPNESITNTPVRQSTQSNVILRHVCNFVACHTCRPFYQDRMSSSFEPRLDGQVPPLTPGEIARLPIIDRNIAMSIGLRRPPTPLPRSARSQQSRGLAIQYGGDNEDDDISVDWTPTTSSDSDSGSERLDNPELYPCPGPGQCPVWSRLSGCAYDTGFDDGRRAFNHGYVSEQAMARLTPENSRCHLRHLMGSLANTPEGTSSTASSLSLPTPSTSPLTSLTPTDDSFDIALQKKLGKAGKAQSVCGLGSEIRKVPLRGKASHGSLGSEVEVEGGVALTEEAVGSRMPDIITVD